MDGRNYYAPGQWNGLCDRCNAKTKSGNLKQDWQGFIVCPSCYEVRHPQDFIRAKMDKMVVPFTRPRGTDSFLDFCTIYGGSALPGIAVSGCSISGVDVDWRYWLCNLINNKPISDIAAADCSSTIDTDMKLYTEDFLMLTIETTEYLYA
jgi:hypothetical protein